MIETVAMVESIRLDVAAVITAISLVITAVATFLVALRSSKSNGSSTDRAVAVTKIVDTEDKVETLIQQVDFLFEEIARLRNEKDRLEEKVAVLTEDLRREKEAHATTRARLELLLAELEQKNIRIAALEDELITLRSN